jgi:hypothetical protein
MIVDFDVDCDRDSRVEYYFNVLKGETMPREMSTKMSTNDYFRKKEVEKTATYKHYSSYDMDSVIDFANRNSKLYEIQQIFMNNKDSYCCVLKLKPTEPQQPIKQFISSLEN